MFSTNNANQKLLQKLQSSNDQKSIGANIIEKIENWQKSRTNSLKMETIIEAIKLNKAFIQEPEEILTIKEQIKATANK